VIASVSFIGAWVLASPYFGYIGVQIMVAFFLLAFESYSAPTQMTPARDRLLGILLGLVVMLLIFHQIRPERSIDAMRRTLAGLLRAQAGLLRMAIFEPHGTAPSAKMLEARHQIARLVAALHSYSDVVKYEYEPDRTEDMVISDEILDAASCSAELLFGLNAWPEEAGQDALNAKRREVREVVQTVLRTLASSLEQPSESPQESLLKLREDSQELLDALRGAEPVFLEKAVASCRQLQIVCDAIIRSAA